MTSPTTEIVVEDGISWDEWNTNIKHRNYTYYKVFGIRSCKPWVFVYYLKLYNQHRKKWWGFFSEFKLCWRKK